MMVGGILLAIPHWIFDLYDPANTHTSSTNGEAVVFDNLCREANETEEVNDNLHLRNLMAVPCAPLNALFLEETV